MFDKKPESKIGVIVGLKDEEEHLSKSVPQDYEFLRDKPARQRSNTITEGTKLIEIEDKALPTVFKWDGGGKQVYIRYGNWSKFQERFLIIPCLFSGTFSSWKALPMVKSHGDFVTIIDLPEGEHQYKFYVDGEWKHDPKLKNVENDVGSKNNLVSVRRSDFEVFEALKKDSEGAVNNEQKEYSQEIPQSKPWEKVSGPPVLPPHLLQVILNKDTPLSVSLHI